MTGPGLFGGELFVVKLGPCGVHLWSKMVADSSNITTSRVAIGSGGEIWTAGACEGPLDFGTGVLAGSGWDADVYVARLAP